MKLGRVLKNGHGGEVGGQLHAEEVISGGHEVCAMRGRIVRDVRDVPSRLDGLLRRLPRNIEAHQSVSAIAAPISRSQAHLAFHPDTDVEDAELDGLVFGFADVFVKEGVVVAVEFDGVDADDEVEVGDEAGLEGGAGVLDAGDLETFERGEGGRFLAHGFIFLKDFLKLFLFRYVNTLFVLFIENNAILRDLTRFFCGWL